MRKKAFVGLIIFGLVITALPFVNAEYKDDFETTKFEKYQNCYLEISGLIYIYLKIGWLTMELPFFLLLSILMEIYGMGHQAVSHVMMVTYGLPMAGLMIFISMVSAILQLIIME